MTMKQKIAVLVLIVVLMISSLACIDTSGGGLVNNGETLNELLYDGK